MESSNTNKNLKRRAGNELSDGASTSKQPYIDNSTEGAHIEASGQSNININQINVNVKHETHQHSRTKDPLIGIRFQVAEPVASFGGRQRELESVQRAFEEQSNMEPYNLVAVCGYGGIGKTELARKFIQNLRANFNIIWIYAEIESTLCDSFNKLKEELKERGYHCSGQQDVYKHLDNPECLFVFDNAEKMLSISEYLPQQRNNSLFLITSQDLEWSPYESVPLDELDRTSAINVMKVVFGTHRIEISESELKKLLSTLEPIPLVLQIGVGFVCRKILNSKRLRKEYNIDDIIGELSTKCELVTLEFPSFFQSLYRKPILDAVSRTLEKFWNKEDEVSKTTKNMLGVAAYLNADHIEEDMLKELLNLEDEILFNESLTTLVQFSLFQKSSYFYTMHRTVQACVRHLCGNESKPNACYLQSLHVLLNLFYYEHNKFVIQHAEKDFETFRSFYERKKCRALYEASVKHISCNTLQLLLHNFEFNKDPKFLCEAAASERADVIDKLLEHGADFNVMNSDGLGALYYACDWSGQLFGIWKRIEALIKVGANINLQNSQENTVLHILCNVGKKCTEKDVYIFERCALMIQAGGDPTIKNSAGETAADLAQEHGLPLTRRLLEEAMSGCRCILHIAARCKQFNTLYDLLEVNNICNIYKQDESGNTVLHVLAGLDPLDAEDQVNEIKLPYFTADVMLCSDKDIVAVKNKSGETAADVATRAHRMQLADMFQARSSDHIIYRSAVYRQQIEHFSFVSRQDEEQVNGRDVNGGTLLHALCRLDPHGRADLELEVVKPVADLVIRHGADVRIRDKAGVAAAELARSRGWRLLADFLDSATVLVDEPRHKLGAKLMYVAVKHGQFDLIKYAWWRHYILENTVFDYILMESSSELLGDLCGCADSTVTDTDIIRVLNDLDMLNLVASYGEDEYQETIDAANKCGRNELANWLIKHQTHEVHTELIFSQSHEPLRREKKSCIIA